jgi:hypothetical protein
MLKNIRLHIEKNEEKQKELEESLAQNILEAHHKNVNSFDRNIPSLSALIKKPKLQNYSLFCNKFGEINIVDYGVGRTLYGFHPEQEIHQQVEDFNTHAPCFSLVTEKKTLASSENIELNKQTSTLETSIGYQHYLAQHSAPDNIECLVVLGCGLGFHILELMQHKKIQCLIIYEPELQYFQCSILVNKWAAIFELAKNKGTKIFIQVEKDGRNLVSDMNELEQHEKITRFYVYKHYNHPVFSSLLKDLRSKSWGELQENGISFDFSENYNHYIPAWTPSIKIKDYSSCQVNNALFQKNLLALEKYFPAIFQEYKSYEPKLWIPVINSAGQINLIKADSLTPWYGDSPKQDCLYNYENYNEQPHKDGLVLGYKGTKLAHYLHYQFVKQTEQLLSEAEDEAGSLPEEIASIIMFGLGVGYQLEALLKNHSVEKLFLCEPNTDFFYASLYAIDWLNIFETVEKSDARIYLNIGDDGSHLFRDLLHQFHSIGPYILNNTYFYQSYYNASLNSAIAQLREQLQIVISMGEYFDHAYYGIEHTKEGFKRNIPVLVNNPSSKLNYDEKEVPVFIVGNGPSLDLSIDAIRECQSQAIIISCGTALQALHRHGITPDFHAEIEQNRCTYDWAVMIGDVDYLKNITLISCNGIHPDTCDLYKEVLIAFKEGESSTVSALSVLGQEHFEVLQHSFPTVSNFVTNLVSIIGFNHLYFIGVDLGFIDVTHHHSKSSGYYQDDGKETYDYAEDNNTSIIVPGNFRPRVNTKHEFKISRQIIEQVIQKKPKLQTFYNCSDGAKIAGSTALHIDNLLIISTALQKKQTLKQLKSKVFSNKYNASFSDKFETKFSYDTLNTEFIALEKVLSQELVTTEQANQLINKQKEMLFSSYKNGKSLLFYYLYGTSNYANAIFSKLLSATNDSKQINEASIKIKNLWMQTVSKLKLKTENLANGLSDFDISSSDILKREAKSLEINHQHISLLIVTKSYEFKSVVLWTLKKAFPWLINYQILTPQELELDDSCYDFVLYDNVEIRHDYPKGKSSTLLIANSLLPENIDLDGVTTLYMEVLKSEHIVNNSLFAAGISLKACLSDHKCLFIFPKYWTCQPDNLENKNIFLNMNNYVALEFKQYFCFYRNDSSTKCVVLPLNGSRGKRIFETVKMKNLIFGLMKEDELQNAVQQNKNLICSITQDTGDN